MKKVTYSFVKYASKAERKGTHSFHEKWYMEEINVFLINKMLTVL